MTDYTNERWHVDGLTVTHDDFPGADWYFPNRGNTEFLAANGKLTAVSHAARAWLAAQPKPTITVGMRIEATLSGGAVVTGEVTRVTDYSNWAVVQIGGGVTCYADVTPMYRNQGDITDWREVTA